MDMKCLIYVETATNERQDKQVFFFLLARRTFTQIFHPNAATSENTARNVPNGLFGISKKCHHYFVSVAIKVSNTNPMLISKGLQYPIGTGQKISKNL